MKYDNINHTFVDISYLVHNMFKPIQNVSIEITIGSVQMHNNRLYFSVTVNLEKTEKNIITGGVNCSIDCYEYVNNYVCCINNRILTKIHVPMDDIFILNIYDDCIKIWS